MIRRYAREHVAYEATMFADARDISSQGRQPKRSGRETMLLGEACLLHSERSSTSFSDNGFAK